MDKKSIESIFSIIDAITDNECNKNTNKEINILFNKIAEELYNQNWESVKKIAKIIEDSLLNELNLNHGKDYYLGKIIGLSELINHINLFDKITELTDKLSDDELFLLDCLYNRREVLLENSKNDNDFMGLVIPSMVNNRLIISHTIGDYSIYNLSEKGNEVIDIVKKREKKLLNKVSDSYVKSLEHKKQFPVSKKQSRNQINFNKETEFVDEVEKDLQKKSYIGIKIAALRNKEEGEWKDAIEFGRGIETI